MAEDKTRPIIVVKKIKKGHAGAHGGAWKIAYADFVTAMMAFFLLMWLLGSTSEGDLKGISEFFNTPMKVAMLGGSGAGDATSVIKGGGETLSRATGQQMKGGNPDKEISVAEARKKVEKEDKKNLKELKSKIEDAISKSKDLSKYKDQIKLDITTEGLRIQITDEQNRPMFDSGSAIVKPYMREILIKITQLLNEVSYRIAISGHTDAAKYTMGERGYSNWELSSDRANASRREIVNAGLSENKVIRVVGVGSSIPLLPNDPLGPTNRRISILVLNKVTEESIVNQQTIDDLETDLKR
jgi:chemotaxis protein MotB